VETAAAEAAMAAHPSESIRQFVGALSAIQASLDSAIDRGIDRSGLGRVVEAISTKTARQRSLQPRPLEAATPCTQPAAPWIQPATPRIPGAQGQPPRA
jgi:hypothetical protein